MEDMLQLVSNTVIQFSLAYAAATFLCHVEHNCFLFTRNNTHLFCWGCLFGQTLEP